MRQWCGERTTAQAMSELEAAGLPAGPVYTPQQALDDPQAAAMGFLKAIDEYPGLPRPAPVPDLPLRFSSMRAGITARPPQAGEHTDALLGELGYSTEEIAALRAQGIV
jgi:crotonobetainyl-CoA:carnitine CoA-transferase CaiB-like acyl-CoA transferase